MPAEVFLDTNVFVYAFDDTAPPKQTRAKALIFGDRKWTCSWQVVQEFSNVALHKFKIPMKPADLGDYLELVLWPRCGILPSRELSEGAIDIHRAYGYRFYDSLIISSALAAGVRELLSEDLQSGQKIGPLTIKNPFV